MVRGDARVWRYESSNPYGQPYIMTIDQRLPKGTCVISIANVIEDWFSPMVTQNGWVITLRPRISQDTVYGWRDFYRITSLAYPDKPNTPVTAPANTYVSGCALYNLRCAPGKQ